MSGILRCRDHHAYTLQPQCPECGAETVRPGPAKFNPDDPYGSYRRELKRREREAHHG